MDMDQHPEAPVITSAEWLPSGIVVHFDQGAVAFVTAAFLFEHQHEQLMPEPDAEE